MKIDNDDIETIKKDMKDLTACLNIHGIIRGSKKKILSRIGKDCANKIVEALFAQLSAFDKEDKSNAQQ